VKVEFFYKVYQEWNRPNQNRECDKAVHRCTTLHAISVTIESLS